MFTEDFLLVDNPYPRDSHESAHRHGYRAGGKGELLVLEGLNPAGYPAYKTPYPISREDFLVSIKHPETGKFSLYLMDLYGNRELIYTGRMETQVRSSWMQVEHGHSNKALHGRFARRDQPLVRTI